MVDDRSKTQAELDEERRKGSASPENRPVGAEFVPPPGKLASNEQIADFWIARGKWADAGKAEFIARREALEASNPQAALQELVAQTERIRTEVRNDLAKEMSAEEIVRRYESLGQSVRAREFENKQTVFKAMDEPQKAEDLRLAAAVNVQELEERQERNSPPRDEVESENAKQAEADYRAGRSGEPQDRNSAGDDKPEAENTAAKQAEVEPENTTSKQAEADRRTGRDGEMTDGQRARLERFANYRTDYMRLTGKELTERGGPNHDREGLGRTMTE